MAFRAVLDGTTEMLPPRSVAGVGIGLVNGAGNLGGTVGPYFFGYIRELTGNFTTALTMGGTSLIVASMIAVPIRPRSKKRLGFLRKRLAMPPGSDLTHGALAYV